MKIVALACLLSGAGAHVSMIYKASYPAGIRNANSPTGDGRASVAGACGGVNARGGNGEGQVVDGSRMSLTINYAAGHASAQNAFRMAYSCTDTTQDGLASAAAVLTQATHGCTAKVSGNPATYNDNGANGGVPAPNAIVPGGYEVECDLPPQPALQTPNAAPLECTVALIDQRDWGGCVDVLVLPAAAALPPAPPPAPYVSSAGKYYIISANSVDGSGPTFSNCDFSAGYLEVPSHDKGATSFTASLKAQANECRAQPEPVDPATGVAYERTTTILADLSFTMTLDAETAKYEGIADIPYDETDATKTQPYRFSVADQAMDFAYFNPANPTEQPIINDGFSDKNTQGISIGGGDDDSNGAAIAMIVIIILLALALLAGFLWYRKRSAGQAPAGKAAAYTGTQYGAQYGVGGAPPPPPPPGPPPGGALPEGWVEMKDPGSGHSFYHNAKLQQTQWERPGGIPLTGAV